MRASVTHITTGRLPSGFRQLGQTVVFALILTFIRVILGADGSARALDGACCAMIGPSIGRMFSVVWFQGTSGAVSIE
jgi:hypothetical protein